MRLLLLLLPLSLFGEECKYDDNGNLLLDYVLNSECPLYEKDFEAYKLQKLATQAEETETAVLMCEYDELGLIRADLAGVTDCPIFEEDYLRQKGILSSDKNTEPIKLTLTCYVEGEQETESVIKDRRNRVIGKTVTRDNAEYKIVYQIDNDTAKIEYPEELLPQINDVLDTSFVGKVNATESTIIIEYKLNIGNTQVATIDRYTGNLILKWKGAASTFLNLIESYQGTQENRDKKGVCEGSNERKF